MKHLKELVHIVNRNKVKRIELLDLKADDGSKIQRFYQMISGEEVHSDAEAFALLFPGANSRSAYHNLKQRLQERLLNTLFFIDAYQQGHTDRQTAYYELQKEFAATQLLLAKNGRSVAIEMLEKVFRRAARFELTELSVSAARQLRLHYGTRSFDRERYRFYADRCKHYQHLARLENKAEEYYTELILAFKNGSTSNDQLRERSKMLMAELGEEQGAALSYKFNFYQALIRLFYHTCINDYSSAIPVCDETITYFENKPYTASTPIQICLHHKLVAYLQEGNFQQGEQAARQSQQLLESGSFNWFKNLEYLLLLAMHTAEHQQAYEVFSEAVNHKRFAYLPEQVREIWQLYQAYIHLLVDQGEVLPKDNDSNFTSFRINRFLNNVPLFSKDKRGMNIAILSLQILFYIQKRKYGEVIDRMEAITKYCSRYLFKEGTMRSYYFIKLLLCLPKANFHREAALRYAKPILKKLQAIDVNDTKQFHKIEIIPYERLWEMTLNMLDAKLVALSRYRRADDSRSTHA
ncbi:MAG: hypothetical protein AAFY48_02635 [Bacteroidota bacterium]